MPLMIIACSNRKRLAPEVRAAHLSSGSIEAVGRDWLTRLAPLSRRPASELYCGRSVRDGKRAARALDADLLFASAGLGWVRADQDVPSYGMTVVAGDDNVLSRVNEPAGASDWWRWLGNYSPFAVKFNEAITATDGLILVALPRTYLAMVEADLLALPPDHLNRLRIIQRQGAVLERLRPWTQPYDDRLEGGEGHAGTRSDFAARAACHFVEQVLPGHELEDAGAHALAVGAALSAWVSAPMRRGERRTDLELRDIVAMHWDETGGRTTRLLRLLRDDLGIACEQGRFARLVAAMRVEREQVE